MTVMAKQQATRQYHNSEVDLHVKSNMSTAQHLGYCIHNSRTEMNRFSYLEPCWSWENSMTWLVRSLSWRFGILLLRKSSSSWLRFDTSFIDVPSLHTHHRRMYHTNTSKLCTQVYRNMAPTQW